MKTYIKIIIGSVLIGGIIAFIFYKDIKKDVMAMSSTDIVYLFQVGVYKNMDNAVQKCNEYEGNISIKLDDYYRVISGICYSDEICNKLKEYFNDKNINYYLKKFKVNTNFINELKYYEMIIKSTSNSETIDNINKKVNNIFLSYLT